MVRVHVRPLESSESDFGAFFVSCFFTARFDSVRFFYVDGSPDGNRVRSRPTRQFRRFSETASRETADVRRSPEITLRQRVKERSRLGDPVANARLNRFDALDFRRETLL